MGPVIITTRDIYDELKNVSAKVDGLIANRSTETATVTDHETRLRALERWRYALPASAITALLAAIAAIAAAILR